MSSVSKSIIHGTVQTAAGVVVGSALDFVFPDPPQRYDGPDDFIVGAVEVAAQAVANSMVTGGVMSTLLEMDAATSDPGMGMSYVVFSFMAQDKLRRKVSLLVEYVERALGLEPRSDTAVDVRAMPTARDGRRYTKVASNQQARTEAKKSTVVPS